MPSIIKCCSITSSSSAYRAEGGAAQHIPQPAVMLLGTGISRPGSPAAWQTRSIAMAPAVVRKVTTHFSCFWRISFLRQNTDSLRRRIRFILSVEI